jgi:hypothetical protein
VSRRERAKIFLKKGVFYSGAAAPPRMFAGHRTGFTSGRRSPIGEDEEFQRERRELCERKKEMREEQRIGNE